MRRILPFLLTLLLTGCIEQKIYTEISIPSRIGHPPSSVQLIDPIGNLQIPFERDTNSTTKIEVYVHCAKCSSASARALGSDFDGYVRITIFDGEETIARAQMDYKGKPTPESIQAIHDTLINKLQWNSLSHKPNHKT